ncbi:hypothetical protein BSLG_009900 [Batrachochytrium salamandrivorans]|nr:hypothetical protein BSLG_009900 [Batrachochytrium salamandrivorans]
MASQNVLFSGSNSGAQQGYYPASTQEELSFQQFTYGDGSSQGFSGGAGSSVGQQSGGFYNDSTYSASQASFRADMSGGVTWQTIRSAFSTGGFPDEPPLLQGLTVMNPFRQIDRHIMDDTDLAGPILFCFLFGGFLFLSGKAHFGYIYGVATLGWLSMYAILNLMSETGIDGYRTASVLGYALLPMRLYWDHSECAHRDMVYQLVVGDVRDCSVDEGAAASGCVSRSSVVQRICPFGGVLIAGFFFVLLDKTQLPEDASLWEPHARTVAAELGLIYLHPVGELRDHFVFAEPKAVGYSDMTSASDMINMRSIYRVDNGVLTHGTTTTGTTSGTTYTDTDRQQHIVKRCSEHETVLWQEIQVPQQRLFKREFLMPMSYLSLQQSSPLLVKRESSPQQPSSPPWQHSSKFNRGTPIRLSDVTQGLGITDPRFSDQWHLFNPNEPGHDMNITDVWVQGITGSKITVGFIDDGLDYNNPDLKDNFSAEGSYDYNFHKPDPLPTLAEDTHGTRCAGEVAAVKNNVCGVGVAWNAKVAAGVLVMMGKLWRLPPTIVVNAVKNGIDNGRDGLGSLFVFAAGNGGNRGDNCNFDGYTNSIYTITVAAVDRYEGHPGFSEQCPANMISMWSGQGGFSGIVTTDWKDGCTDRHGGTSAAAPLAAGVYALMLSIRPDLSWRDVQRLTVENAIPVNLQDTDWIKTHADRLYNHKYGYGIIDAYQIVEATKSFVNLNPQVNLTIDLQQVRRVIPPFRPEGVSEFLTVTPEMVSQARLMRLEHITVTVDIKHTRRGDITIHLVSPLNVQSRLIEGRNFDESGDGFKNWTMMTVMHWDEAIVGRWKLVVIDDRNASTTVLVPPPSAPSHDRVESIGNDTVPSVSQTAQDPSFEILWYLGLLTLIVGSVFLVYILMRRGCLRMPGYVSLRNAETDDTIALEEVVWSSEDDASVLGITTTRATRTKNTSSASAGISAGGVGGDSNSDRAPLVYK